MIGAGVFSAVGPAAQAAGSGLLIGLVLAAAVAWCNATSSAALAAVHPASGGAYVYGRERLGAFWGFLAGWGFVVGKIASCAAVALTVGAYAAPSLQRPIAVAAVIGLTAVNYRGVRKTAVLTRVIVAIVLVALTLVVAGALLGGAASPDRFGSFTDHGTLGVLQSAGVLFFAFAGYARIATLGEEVVDPARTIPRAIPVALGITLVVYAVVVVSALAAIGPAALAASDAPLATAVAAGDLDAVVPAVRIGGTIAGLGVLVSLIAGVSRTGFAMADDRQLPGWLAAVHPVHQVPHRAEVAAATIIVALVAVTDLRGAIGFSSFCVLAYYGIANASAWTLPPEHRRRRGVAVAGLAGCATLAITLPALSAICGACVLVAGALIWAARHVRAGQCSATRPGR